MFHLPDHSLVLGAMMRIFITGGTGYIGSHCAALFLEHGHEVILYDNLHNSERDVVDRLQALSKNSISLIEGDIRDEPLVLNSLRVAKLMSCCIAQGSNPFQSLWLHQIYMTR